MEIEGSGIKVRQLQVLREVMRTGSERRAARGLKVSQPAVNQSLRQLEASVGFSLFRRESNKLIPTEKAWEFFRTVDVALASIERIGKSLEFIKTNDVSSVSIAAPSVFSFGTIPLAVKQIHVRNPSHVFRIKSGSYQEIADHVLAGRADLGISRLPLDEQAFEWSALATAKNVCLFPPGHRFEARQIIRPEDLVDEPIIDIDPQFSSHQMNVNAMRYMGVQPHIAVEYDANGHDAGYVAAGVGVSITNEILARECASLELRYRPFEPGAVYHYVVFWQRDRELSDNLRSTIEALVAANTAVGAA